MANHRELPIGTMGIDVKTGGRKRSDGVETLGGIDDIGRAKKRRGRNGDMLPRRPVPEGTMVPDQTFEGDRLKETGSRYVQVSKEEAPVEAEKDPRGGPPDPPVELPIDTPRGKP